MPYVGSKREREDVNPAEERQKEIAAVDDALSRGVVADLEAGRVHSAEQVFDELRERCREMVRGRRE